MALDIAKLYISLLSGFFTLSDMAVMLSSAAQNDSSLPPLLPAYSSSFTTAHWLTKILGEVQEAVGEVNGMDISNEVEKGSKALIESMRWRFEDILINAWVRGWLAVFEHSLIFHVVIQMQISSTTWNLGLQALPIHPLHYT
jgi:exocyst complex component 2